MIIILVSKLAFESVNLCRYSLDNTSIAHAYVLTNVHSVVIVCCNFLTGREKVPTAHVLGRGVRYYTLVHVNA